MANNDGKNRVWKVTYRMHVVPVRPIDDVAVEKPEAYWTQHSLDRYVLAGPTVESLVEMMRTIADVGTEFNDEDCGWVMRCETVETQKVERMMQVDN